MTEGPGRLGGLELTAVGLGFWVWGVGVRPVREVMESLPKSKRGLGFRV